MLPSLYFNNLKKAVKFFLVVLKQRKITYEILHFHYRYKHLHSETTVVQRININKGFFFSINKSSLRHQLAFQVRDHAVPTEFISSNFIS